MNLDSVRKSDTKLGQSEIKSWLLLRAYALPMSHFTPGALRRQSFNLGLSSTEVYKFTPHDTSDY